MPLVSPPNIHTKCTKRALLVMISGVAYGVLSCVHTYIACRVLDSERRCQTVRLYAAVLANVYISY
jgi:hypothetical protein